MVARRMLTDPRLSFMFQPLTCFILIGLIIWRSNVFLHRQDETLESIDHPFCNECFINFGMKSLGHIGTPQINRQTTVSRNLNQILQCIFLLLSISGDIETNPGPVKFPCGI